MFCLEVDNEPIDGSDFSFLRLRVGALLFALRGGTTELDLVLFFMMLELPSVV